MDTVDFKWLQLNKRFHSKAFVGTLVLRVLKEYFSEQDIYWSLRQHTLFVSVDNQALKIEIFKEKAKLLAKINEKLHTLGYSLVVKDIYFKTQPRTDEEDVYL